MNRNDVMNIGKWAARHLRVLWKGFTRMTVGCLTAATMAVAGYGYAMIPTEGGYTAVSEFLLATVLLITALGCMYAMGGRAGKAGRR